MRRLMLQCTRWDFGTIDPCGIRTISPGGDSRSVELARCTALYIRS
jgi:hypothetical protein